MPLDLFDKYVIMSFQLLSLYNCNPVLIYGDGVATAVKFFTTLISLRANNVFPLIQMQKRITRDIYFPL
jgi:hypothetical protein